MKLFGLEITRETRASPEDPRVPVSAANFLQFFGQSAGNMPAVTIDSALTVPAVNAAVSFLSGTLANLPLHSYRSTGADSQRITGGLQILLNEAPNPEWSSFGWRKYFWQQVFTGGRGLSWIERSAPGVVANIWPMDPARTIIKRQGLMKVYQFDGSKEYPAADVIDVPFMLKPDGLRSYSPILNGAKTISLALAMSDYASGFFAGGGVPPLALSGPIPAGPDAMKRANADIKRAIEAARSNGDAYMPIPSGYDLKAVGFDPAKGQMTEAMRFLVEEIARLYNLPPVFLQDLTHGTFSNTEQQDLHLTKHLVAQWAKALEDELNLKLFGQKRNARFVEHNLDGLQRGDFKSRMDGMAQAVQSGLLTPNEGRALDNRPAQDGGDKLFIQGATVPLAGQQNGGATNVP